MNRKRSGPVVPKRLPGLICLGRSNLTHKTQTIDIWKGETFDLVANVRSDDGLPVDLSDPDFEAHLDLDAESGPLTYTGTTDADGVVTIKVSDETTLTWDGSSSYKLVLDYPNGDVKYLLVGKLYARDWTTT